MLGIAYIILSFFLGWAICSHVYPKLEEVTYLSYHKRKINLSPYLLLFPVWYVVGTLALTWTTYLMAYFFSSAQTPLLTANVASMTIAFLVSTISYYYKVIKNKEIKNSIFCADKVTKEWEFILLAAIICLAIILMWVTFFVADHKLYVGVSVFSDFSPHIGMIRSFSSGNNFPTSYSHFAGEDIRYHFLFQFMVGNLEYLGLRIDYAFNIPSILSFVSAFLLLYILAVKITGKIGAGLLACLFFAFRSSKTLFTYLTDLPKGVNILEALKENTEFISSTPNENWGLWNLNVYCNQRHLAFGFTVVFFIILLFLPHIYEMFAKLKHTNFVVINEKKVNIMDKTIYYLKMIFFTKEGWIVKDLKLSLASGIILGSLSFFHGSALIGCLLVLFVIAILANRRLEFLIVALIAVGMSVLQSRFFVDGSVVNTGIAEIFQFGFIAENKTIFGVLSYLERLLGVLPFVLLAAICVEKGVKRYLILAFSAPLIFSFYISLTIDVTVNHKYIMFSCILLGILAASILFKMLERKDIIMRIVSVILIIMLTATGIYDFTTVLKKNKKSTAIVLDLNSDLTKWIQQNSDAKDVFLSSHYAINQVVLGGAMLYYGWPYFAWSAGYDTDYRYYQVKYMYEAKTPHELDNLVKENKIRFIIVDRDNRTSTEYMLNEDNIKATYQSVYEEGYDEWLFTIYDTSLPIYNKTGIMN